MNTSTAPEWVAINVRWMLARDLDQILAIERESFEFPWTRKQLVGCLRQRNVVGIGRELKVEVNDSLPKGKLVETFTSSRATLPCPKALKNVRKP